MGRNLVEADENTKVLAILNEKIEEADAELDSVIKTLQQSKMKREKKVSHYSASREKRRREVARVPGPGFHLNIE